MTEGEGDVGLAAALARLAAYVPREIAEALAEAVRAGRITPASTRRRIAEEVPQPQAGDRAAEALQAWAKDGAAAEAVALAVEAAARAVGEADSRRERIEVVWTGPESPANVTRRTDRVLLDLIERAGRRVTVVSYTVYDVPDVVDALDRAIGRGVEASVVLDLPPRSNRSAWDNLKALRWPKGRKRPRLLYWPATTADEKPKKDGTYVPKLHAKCAVADGRELLVTSANLTSRALDENMELGLRITGGAAPREVEEHFRKLAVTGILRDVPGEWLA